MDGMVSRVSPRARVRRIPGQDGCAVPFGSTGMNTIARSLSLLALGLAASDATRAATRVELADFHVARLAAQYRAAVRATGPAASANERHAEWIGLDRDSDLQLLRVEQDADGTRHYRYRQRVRGLPVWGEHILVAEFADGR